MNILLSVNDAFCRQAVVLLQSLAENNKEPLQVYVVYSVLAEQNILLLQSFCAQKGIALHLIGQEDARFDGLRVSGHFPHEVYYRILAHEYLPQSEDRVLYLDTDIVCNGDLSALYHMDFQGKYLVAVAGQDRFAAHPEEIRDHWDEIAAAHGEYFDNGVLLINCKRLREEAVTLDTYRAVAGRLVPDYYFDQGLFNAMFARDAVLLPMEDYNYRYGTAFLRAGGAEVAPNRKAKLVHYASEISPSKPWDLVLDDDELAEYAIPAPKRGDAPYFVVNRAMNELARLWWSYAEKTPVYAPLYAEMQTKKEWFKRGICNHWKRLMAVAEEE